MCKTVQNEEHDKFARKLRNMIFYFLFFMNRKDFIETQTKVEDYDNWLLEGKSNIFHI